MDINRKGNTLRTGGHQSQSDKHNYDIIKINSKDSCILQLGRGFNKGGIHKHKTPTITKNSWEQNNLVIQLNPSIESGGNQPYQQNRIYADYGQMPALTAELGGRNNIYADCHIRRLTPTECARLQTIPDWYKWIVSDTQQYKMLGNGWTVEIIKHILSFLTVSNKEHYFKRL